MSPGLRQAEVSATTSTWELAKQIAHAEGIDYEPTEEDVALVSSSEDQGRCLCSEVQSRKHQLAALGSDPPRFPFWQVGSRVQLWGHDAGVQG